MFLTDFCIEKQIVRRNWKDLDAVRSFLITYAEAKGINPYDASAWRSILRHAKEKVANNKNHLI